MTENEPPRRRSWTGLLTESLVIVASILFAFWIDATWEVRSDRARTQGHLEAVRSELGENLVLLDSSAVNCERVIGANIPVPGVQLVASWWSR